MTPAVTLYDDASAASAALARSIASTVTLERLPAAANPTSPRSGCTCAFLPIGEVDSGMEALRALRTDGYEGPVIFYANNPPEEIVRSTITHGAQDIIDPLRETPEVILHAISMAATRLEAVRIARAGSQRRHKWIADRHSEAQSIAHVGSWEVDVQTWSAEWSPEVRRIIGISESEPVPGVEGYAQHVHPDDRVRVTSEMLGLFRRGKQFESDHRVVLPDATVRHVSAKGRCELAEDGSIRRAYGTLHDVTEMRIMQESLRSERDFASALLGAIRDGYLFIKGGEIVDMNEEFLRMTGFARADLIGAKRPYPFWPADEVENLLEATANAAVTGAGTNEAIYATKDGRRIDVLLSSRTARGGNGEPLGLVTTVRDNSGQKRRERALNQLANEDGLTGLQNRRAFDVSLRREYDRARRSLRPSAVAIIDVDHFKSVNDRFGHMVGDAVLKEVAERLRSTVRTADVLGRVGGEEVGWILVDQELPQALQAAERIRDRIASTPFPTVGKLTISIGVAMLSDAKRAEDAYGNADKALYQAKRTGRNRCVAAGLQAPAQLAA